jgi:hypothetical protein
MAARTEMKPRKIMTPIGINGSGGRAFGFFEYPTSWC